MGQKTALENNRFDVRLINWNLKRGIITEKDVEAYKASLPDTATNARTIEIPMDEEEQQAETQIN